MRGISKLGLITLMVVFGSLMLSATPTAPMTAMVLSVTAGIGYLVGLWDHEDITREALRGE